VTLIALLQTVALSWQQETLADNAREVQTLGAQLYERLRTMGKHMQTLERSLTSSVKAYNDVVGSLENRVLVTARRFPDLGVVGSGSAEISELSPVDRTPRRLQAVEFDDDEEHPQGTLLALPEGEAGTG
jgi:DNA recombination protein RmuC